MKTIKLTMGLHAVVDDEDYENVSKYNWCASLTSNGGAYAVRGVWNPATKKTQIVALHRWLLGAGAGQVGDHINGDTLDNRRSNLRICTNAENIRKMRKPSKGVHLMKSRAAKAKPWQAYIGARGSVTPRRHLGYFASKEEAQEAYNRAASKAFGDFFAPPQPKSAAWERYKEIKAQRGVALNGNRP